MTKVTVFAVGGTGESWPGDPRTEVTGLLAAVTASLDDRFVCRWIAYPASYGPVPARDGMSFAASVAAGTRSLSAALDATDGPVMLIGYSQGCVVIRQTLAERTRHAMCADHVIGVGFIADPHQPAGVVPGCEGSGVAGPGADLPADTPVLWIADSADMICNAAPDSLLRDIADLTGSLSLRDVTGWLRASWNILRRNAFQNAARTSVRPRQWRRDLTRIRCLVIEIVGYLPAVLTVGGVAVRNRRGGRHTAYASEPLRGRDDVPGSLVLAQWMAVQATFASTEFVGQAA